MRIAVSGGGTAGHVSPVLATVDALQAQAPDRNLDVLFIGSRGGMEAELARDAGLHFVGIFGGKLRRYPGRGLLGNLTDLANIALNLRDMLFIVIGIFQALWILGRFRPQALFDKVGPAGLPVGIAARILGIPTVLHEPDVVPGLGNRILSRWAAKIAVGFPVSTYHRFPHAKLSFTGNPVQPRMLSGEAKRGRAHWHFSAKRPLTLVVGGSQGAVAINEALIAALPKLSPVTQILHVCGEHSYAKMSAATQGAAEYAVEPFLPLETMADAYAAADIVVARAGANTIAELAALGKPTILIPNHLAAAHQLANAKVLADAGAIVLCSENPTELTAVITSLAGDKETRDRLGEAISTFNKPHAASAIAHLIERVAK